MGTYVRLRVAAEAYAVPVGHVLAIVGPGELTPVPGSLPEILGVRKLRGQIVPIINLPLVLGLAAAAPQQPPQLLLAEVEGVKAGFTIDEVSSVGDLDGPLDGVESNFLLGVTVRDGEPLGVIDVPRILRSLARAGS
ncbi:MAG: chemotaxis protein CheW [Streptosporangiaceae bacterium]